MCGPEGMMQEVESALKIFNVPADNIHQEHFGTGIVENTEEDDDGSLKEQTVTIQYEGTDYQVVAQNYGVVST